MLETCGKPLPTGKQGQPILINYKTEAVVDFLNLIYTGRINGRNTWKRFEMLLSLIDQYDAPKLKCLAVQGLFEVLPQARFEVFAMASQMGNVPLAKMAIAHFLPNLQLRKFADLICNPMCEVRLDFLVGLLRAAETANIEGVFVWTKAADTFRLD